MRVLMIMPDAFGGHGGIAEFNRNFLRALCAHPNCQEVVAVPRHMPHPIEPLPAKLTYLTSGLNGKLNYALAVLKLVYNDSKFDLIVCGLINLLPIAFLLRLRVRAPLILIVHGIEAWGPRGRPVAEYLTRKVDAFISVSKVTKQRFLAWTKLSCDQGLLLPNALALDRFGPGEKNSVLIDRYGLAGKTVLMTLGRLASKERYKGFDEVLELLPLLSEKLPDVAYLVVGDGPDRRRLEEKTRALGVHDRVVFAGLIPEAEKPDHYRLADAFVMPSRGEGFGIVYLEAMASGVPVVASRVDGSREAVRDGALGILVDPSNEEEMIRGIFEALNQTKRLVPEGLAYFSYENFERRLHHIIDGFVTSWTKKR